MGKDFFVAPRNLGSLFKTGREAVDRLPRAHDDPTLAAAMVAGFASGLDLLEDAAPRSTAFFAADHGPASLIQSFLAEQAELQELDLAQAGRLVPAGEGFEVKFDERELGWVQVFFQWWRGKLAKHPFVAPTSHVDTIPDHARLAILGDWGTGRYGAPPAARFIESATTPYDVVLHLGDVYYSGTKKEVQTRFLDVWPRLPGALHRAVNSNHEMYAGGHGYFDLTLPQFGQPSSCFAFQNDHFLFLGLDTGYDEHELGQGQGAWVNERLDAAGSRNVVLLSHHQPFSLFETHGNRLVLTLLDHLAAKKIAAWYWGHEHRCVVYDRHPHWGLQARCVGHSGFPYFRDNLAGRPIEEQRAGVAWHRVQKDGVPSGLVLDGPNPFIDGDNPARFGPNGWMTLEVDGPRAFERYHGPDGTVQLERDLL